MNPAMSNAIIIAVIIIMVFFGIKNSIPHFKGEGSCCGGGSGIKAKKPQKLDRVISVKRIYIEGMTCDNCRIRIQNALNSIDGVNAKVSRSRGVASIKLGRDVDDETLKRTITDLGYKVVDR